MDPYREAAPPDPPRPSPRRPLYFPPVWIPLDRSDEVLLVWLGSLVLAVALASCGR